MGCGYADGGSLLALVSNEAQTDRRWQKGTHRHTQAERQTQARTGRKADTGRHRQEARLTEANTSMRTEMNWSNDCGSHCDLTRLSSSVITNPERKTLQIVTKLFIGADGLCVLRFNGTIHSQIW